MGGGRLAPTHLGSRAGSGCSTALLWAVGAAAGGGGLLSTQAGPPFVASPTACPPPARKLLLHPPHSLSLQTSILSPSLWPPLLHGSPSFLLLSVPQFSLAPHLGSLPSYLSWDPLPRLWFSSFSFCAPSDPLLGGRPAFPQTTFSSFSESCPGRFS